MKAEKAMEDGKWEESESFIVQSNLLFQQGSASNTEHKLAAQALSKLHGARDVFDTKARGLEALAAGVRSSPTHTSRLTPKYPYTLLDCMYTIKATCLGFITSIIVITIQRAWNFICPSHSSPLISECDSCVDQDMCSFLHT